MSASDPADRRLALITGASAGIGQALARVYAEHGWDVALTARRTDRLEALADELKLRAGVETIVIPEDLADPAAPERLIEDRVPAVRDRFDADVVEDDGARETVTFKLPRVLTA